MNVERIDFVSVFTQDIERAKEFYAGMDDVDAARSALEAKGVEFDGETLVTDVCRMAFFKDPDGNALLLHRRFDA